MNPFDVSKAAKFNGCGPAGYGFGNLATENGVSWFCSRLLVELASRDKEGAAPPASELTNRAATLLVVAAGGVILRTCPLYVKHANFCTRLSISEEALERIIAEFDPAALAIEHAILASRA